MKLKKLFALLLCACMLLSVLPMGTLAGLLTVGDAPAQEEEGQTSGGFLTVDGDEPEEEHRGFLTVDGDEDEDEHHGFLTVDGDDEDGDEDDEPAPVIPAPSQVYICEWCGWADGYHADDCPSHVDAEPDEPAEPADGESEPKPDKSEVRAYAAAANTFADIFDALLEAEDLDEYEAILNELDEEQQTLFFDLLDEDELDALEAVEAELAEQAVTDYQADATEVLTFESRVAAYRSAMAVALQSAAEENVTCTCEAEDDEHTETCALTVAALYQALLACETCDEMNDIAATVTDAQRGLLTDDMLAAIQAHYAALEEAEEAPVTTTVTGDYAPPFTSAGPLIDYDTPDEDEDEWYGLSGYSAFDYSTFGVSTLADDGEDGSTPTTSGLKLNKTAKINNDGTSYTITLEAYATGESVTTYVKKGVDIVLMLDLSQYMYGTKTTEKDSYNEVISTTTLSTLYNYSKAGTKYYYKSGSEYVEVEIGRTTQSFGGPDGGGPGGGGNQNSYTYTITIKYNSETLVSGKNGDTQLRQAGSYNNKVTLYTKSTTTEETTDYDNTEKLEALKSAVNSFIGTVHEAAPASRIAIVTYADEASVESGTKEATDGALVTVNDEGKAALNKIVSGLSIANSGGLPSNSHYAAADAVKIFQSVDKDSSEYKRSRVAILFSAGIPGDGWTTNDDKTGGKDIAQATMHLSTILKTAKGTDASLKTGDYYTNPQGSNFAGGEYWYDSDIQELLSNYSDGWNAGCGATVYCVGLDIPTSGDPRTVDMNNEPYLSGAMANEYFWRISSHRPNGSHIFEGYSGSGQYESALEAAFGTSGKTLYNSRLSGTSYGSLYFFYPDELTRNQEKGYYLTATSTHQSELNKLTEIFESIGSQAVKNESSSTTLGTEAVIKDIMSPQFQLSEGAEAENITVETYAFEKKNDNGDYVFENEGTNLSSTDCVTVDPKTNTVSVTGFNFSENWCGYEEKDGERTPHGQMLRITFTIVPKEGFLGGNNVPTNDENSGVYENSNATEPLSKFPQPEANVPIKSGDTTIESNVYLGGYYGETITADQIKNNTKITVDDVELDLSKDDYGIQDWQKESVTIEVKITDTNEVAIDSKKLTDDLEYTVTVTIKPKTEAKDTSDGSKNGMNGEDSTMTGTIHVFKPELTYKDSTVWYGDTVPTGYEGNLTHTRWVHTVLAAGGTATVDKVAGEDGVTMLDDASAPTLSISYTTPEGAIDGDGKIDTPNDIPVDVTVIIGNWEVTEYVSFKHTDCDGKTCGTPENGKFWLHVNTCSLTINKTWASYDATYYQDAVFTVSGDGTSLKVVAPKPTGSTSSITITGLKVGTYTVTEDTNWAWRYESTSNPENGQITLSADTPESSKTITFTNTLKTDGGNKWLDFTINKKNVFEKKEED